MDRNHYFESAVSKEEAPDYYTIIEKPMHWDKIKDKLERHEYSNVQEFKVRGVCSHCRLHPKANLPIQDDVYLVLDNSIKYNTKPDHLYHRVATRIKTNVLPVLDKLVGFSDHPGVGDLEPSLEVLDILLSSESLFQDVSAMGLHTSMIVEPPEDPLQSLFAQQLIKLRPPEPTPSPDAARGSTKTGKKGRRQDGDVRVRVTRSRPGAHLPTGEGESDTEGDANLGMNASPSKRHVIPVPRTRNARALQAAFEAEVGASISRSPSVLLGDRDGAHMDGDDSEAGDLSLNTIHSLDDPSEDSAAAADPARIAYLANLREGNRRRRAAIREKKEKEKETRRAYMQKKRDEKEALKDSSLGITDGDVVVTEDTALMPVITQTPGAGPSLSQDSSPMTELSDLAPEAEVEPAPGPVPAPEISDVSITPSQPVAAEEHVAAERPPLPSSGPKKRGRPVGSTNSKPKSTTISDADASTTAGRRLGRPPRPRPESEAPSPSYRRSRRPKSTPVLVSDAEETAAQAQAQAGPSTYPPAQFTGPPHPQDPRWLAPQQQQYSMDPALYVPSSTGFGPGFLNLSSYPPLQSVPSSFPPVPTMGSNIPGPPYNSRAYPLPPPPLSLSAPIPQHNFGSPAHHLQSQFLQSVQHMQPMPHHPPYNPNEPFMPHRPLQMPGTAQAQAQMAALGIQSNITPGSPTNRPRKRTRRDPSEPHHGHHVAFTVHPQVVDGVDDKQSFTMFNAGWVLPEGSSRRRKGGENGSGSDGAGPSASTSQSVMVPSSLPSFDAPPVPVQEYASSAQPLPQEPHLPSATQLPPEAVAPALPLPKATSKRGNVISRTIVNPSSDLLSLTEIVEMEMRRRLRDKERWQRTKAERAAAKLAAAGGVASAAPDPTPSSRKAASSSSSSRRKKQAPVSASTLQAAGSADALDFGSSDLSDLSEEDDHNDDVQPNSAIDAETVDVAPSPTRSKGKEKGRASPEPFSSAGQQHIPFPAAQDEPYLEALARAERNFEHEEEHDGGDEGEGEGEPERPSGTNSRTRSQKNISRSTSDAIADGSVGSALAPGGPGSSVSGAESKAEPVLRVGDFLPDGTLGKSIHDPYGTKSGCIADPTMLFSFLSLGENP